MIYKCNECGKTFKRKSHYDFHMNRKYPCSQMEDENIDNIQIELPQQKYQCPKCYLVLSRQDALNRHMKKSCKEIDNNDSDTDDHDVILREILEEMNKRIETLETENKVLKGVTYFRPSQRARRTQNNIANANINNNSNNNNNNSTTTVINNNNNHNSNLIVPFNTENFDSVLSLKQRGELMRKGLSGVTELFKYIHFNEDLPQFHNCYISNLRSKYGIIYTGGGWGVILIEELIDQIIDKNGNYLEEKYNELKDKLHPYTKTQFERYLKAKVAEKDVLHKRYVDNIEPILYNGSQMVVDTRNRETERLKVLNKSKVKKLAIKN